MLAYQLAAANYSMMGLKYIPPRDLSLGNFAEKTFFSFFCSKTAFFSTFSTFLGFLPKSLFDKVHKTPPPFEVKIPLKRRTRSCKTHPVRLCLRRTHGALGSVGLSLPRDVRRCLSQQRVSQHAAEQGGQELQCFVSSALAVLLRPKRPFFYIDFLLSH